MSSDALSVRSSTSSLSRPMTVVSNKSASLIRPGSKQQQQLNGGGIKKGPNGIDWPCLSEKIENWFEGAKTPG